MYYNDGTVMVKKMPGDGHCLFSAILHQLYHQEVGTEEHQTKVMELRQRIVEHIKLNIEDYRASIADTIAGLTHLGRGDSESRIQTFLQKLAETNEWGGQETIAASSRIFNRRIDVYYEEGPMISFNRPAAASGVLRIAYRSFRGSRNSIRTHYDSVIQRLQAPDRNNNDMELDNTLLHPVSRITHLQFNTHTNASQFSNASGVIRPIHGSPMITEEDKFPLMSWNVRGCSEARDRKSVV